jgi:hypothetical protein
MTELSVNHEDLTPPPAAGLNIQDIVQLLNVVDAACRRGAFRAEEMSGIGSVYDKVLEFLKSTGAIKEDKEEQDSTGSE